jgi:hypothetical protein
VNCGVSSYCLYLSGVATFTLFTLSHLSFARFILHVHWLGSTPRDTKSSPTLSRATKNFCDTELWLTLSTLWTQSIFRSSFVHFIIRILRQHSSSLKHLFERTQEYHHRVQTHLQPRHSTSSTRIFDKHLYTFTLPHTPTSRCFTSACLSA